MSDPVFTHFNKVDVKIPDAAPAKSDFMSVRDQSKVSYDGGTKHSVFATKDKVNFTTSVRKVNTRGKSVWTTWDTIQSFGFYRNSAGYLQPYHSYRVNGSKKWGAEKVDIVWDALDPSSVAPNALRSYREQLMTGASDAFRHYCKHMLGVSDFTDIYKFAARSGIIKYKYMPKTIRSAYRAEDEHEFAGRIFGKSRLSQAIVLEASNTDPVFLELAHSLRGYVDDSRLKFILLNRLDDDMLEYLDGTDSLNIREVARIVPREVWNRISVKPINLGGLKSVKTVSRNPHAVIRTAKAALPSGTPIRGYRNDALFESAKDHFESWESLTEADDSIRANGGIIRSSVSAGNAIANLGSVTMSSTTATNRMAKMLTVAP